jgi:glycosyltransferase involved in cell wall biosynthesis
VVRDFAQSLGELDVPIWDRSNPAMLEEQPFSIVCLSSQPWDAPLPTNRQQIMSRAAGRGHGVLFVETGDFIGKHLWRFVRGPHRRAVARQLVSGTSAAPNVRVRQLLNLMPFAQRFGWCNRANWRFGAAMLRREARALPAPRVLWIYDPRGADAIGSFSEAFAVYDCVDDYQHQAGPSPRSRALVGALDLAAGARSRLVFATTPQLKRRHERRSGGVHLVPNAGDFDHFHPAAEREHAFASLRDLPRPVLGFAGNLVEHKVDFDLLAELAQAFSGATLLLAGPAEGSNRQRVTALASTAANVHWLGPQPYADLPHVLAAFDVGLIPYVENEYTRNVFPLKVFEYLAAGKPVVASGLPSVAGLESYVFLANDHDAFRAGVLDALSLGPELAQGRMELAARNTWEHRTQRLLALVDAELDS